VILALLIGVAIGGLFVIQDVMTNGGQTVEPTADEPSAENETQQNSSTQDETQTESNFTDLDGPKEYTLSHRINESKYEWDTWRDPDDPSQSGFQTERSQIDSEDVEYHIFKEVNEIRSDRNLSEYEYSVYLSSVGRAHSEDMYDRSYFAHENPDGERIWNRFNTDEGQWTQACERISENIAQNWVGQLVENDHSEEPQKYWTEEEIADAIVQQWMHSDAHRKAMLHPDNDIHGIGVYVIESDDESGGKVYATQGFCDYQDSGSEWANEDDTDTREE